MAAIWMLRAGRARRAVVYLKQCSGCSAFVLIHPPTT
jgi:hypothetical protein